MKIILADRSGDLIQAWQNIAADKSIVSCHNGSLFDVTCDAIVSPANSYGFMDGGIDLAISNYFGWNVQKRLQKRIQTAHHGELLVGMADIVPTDHKIIPYVIAAPTMRIPMIIKDTVNVYLAIRAVLRLIKYGMFEDGTVIDTMVETVAFPGMGTGIGQVSPVIFARQMKQAIEDITEEKTRFPRTWWEAAQRHQLLYGDVIKDLQSN